MIELHHGDCRDILPTIEDKSIDLVLTDIPYGEVNRKSNGLRNLDKSFADVVGFEINKLIFELNRVCKGSIYIFCGTEQISTIREHLVNYGLSTRLCIWEKTNPSPMNGQYIWLSGIECCVYGKNKNAVFNEKCKNTVWRYPFKKHKKDFRENFHPTEKPVELFNYLVKTSTNKNNLILDCFMGSGTTGVSCKYLDRSFIGIEKEKEYFNIAEERINGTKPEPEIKKPTQTSF